MKKENVLYISEDCLTIIDMKYCLQEYTKNNGGYPDFIDLDSSAVDRYQSVLIGPSDRNNLKFMGIKIREVK